MQNFAFEGYKFKRLFVSFCILLCSVIIIIVFSNITMAMVFVITFMTSQSTAIFTGSVQVFGKKCDTLIFALVKASGFCFIV